MSRIFFIILILTSYNLKSNDSRSALTVSGGTSTLQTSNKLYKVHYSIGQQGPIGKNSILDNLLKVKISPNPFTEVLDIVFSEEIKNKIKIKVYDLMGRLVYDDELPEVTEHKIHLNSIPNSQFILRLESEKKYFQTKIIKRK